MRRRHQRGLVEDRLGWSSLPVIKPKRLRKVVRRNRRKAPRNTIMPVTPSLLEEI